MNIAKVVPCNLQVQQKKKSELTESQQLLSQDGFRAELIEDLPSHYRKANFNVGVLLPDDGEIQPAQYVRQCVRRFQERGLRVFENSPVLEINDGSEGVECVCANGSISAQVAIVCTNAQIANLCPILKNKVDPVRGQMLSTSPVPPIFERPIYADHGYDYWRQCPDGRIVLGGWRNLDPDTEVGCDEVLHPDIQGNMEAFLRRFEALQNITIENRWSGIMSFSYDGLPLMGALPSYTSTLVAVGFTGHGFGFAQLVGEEVAKIAIEEVRNYRSLWVRIAYKPFICAFFIRFLFLQHVRKKLYFFILIYVWNSFGE